jgi:hypothetical protein
MALNFPASPTVGQTYVYATTGTTWVWNGSSWNIQTNGNFANVTVSGDILPTSNATSDIGSLTNQFGDIYGTAYRARYADLAERYAADSEYTYGTVMVFGGSKEVTASSKLAQTGIAGVISENPALCMNDTAGNDSTHPYIALQGRVPCKVIGKVKKGDILVASDVVGHAVTWNDQDADPRMTAYIGIAIEDKIGDEAGYVEVKVGK